MSKATDLKEPISELSCPHLMSCDYPVNETYFNNFCNTMNHKNCFQYSKKENLLQTPVKWLQKIAVEKERRLR